jgi:hypothetical protein
MHSWNARCEERQADRGELGDDCEDSLWRSGRIPPECRHWEAVRNTHGDTLEEARANLHEAVQNVKRPTR